MVQVRFNGTDTHEVYAEYPRAPRPRIRSPMIQKSFLFSPFRLYPEAEQLWREEQRIPLRPKALAVLYHLIVQRERVVPKAALLKAA